MAVRTDEPPDTARSLGRGIEQFHHPRPIYAGGWPTPERVRLMAGLSGRVLEFGAGDGVKLTCYPAEVSEVVLVEADPFLRGTAEQVAARVTVPVRVVGGSLTRVPAPDAAFDAVVTSLALCASPSAAKTLEEVRRVLRPGGELRFYEHQRSANQLLATCEKLLWSRVLGGCHPASDCLAALDRAGFAIIGLDRLTYCHVSHVLGSARPR
ncbi:class I SAM-dependent methyltransferase [Nonomuraea longicatena]|uniref:class I SAM-dependent methyltransferase n=1 Tax=Nonomuraea longicatena TaxID=83682 RepID=UPI0031DB9C3F